MSQFKSNVNVKVIQAILELREKLNFVVVKLEDGTQFDFPVPTLQEIRDKFFFKKAKTQPDRPARPPNKFFIFRTTFQSAIHNLKLQVPVVSSLASEVWKKCTLEVVEIFTRLSDTAKVEHGQLNPGYTYKPNRKRRVNRGQNNSTLFGPAIALSSSPTAPTAPIWTAPSRMNRMNLFPQQGFYPPITLALQTNSFTTIESFAVYPSQLSYTTIDPSIHSIHYMSPIEQPVMYIPHNVMQYNALSANLHSHPAPTVDYLCLSRGDSLSSMSKNASKEPLHSAQQLRFTGQSTGQSSDKYEVHYPELEDKNLMVIERTKHNH